MEKRLNIIYENTLLLLIKEKARDLQLKSLSTTQKDEAVIKISSMSGELEGLVLAANHFGITKKKCQDAIYYGSVEANQILKTFDCGVEVKRDENEETSKEKESKTFVETS